MNHLVIAPVLMPLVTGIILVLGGGILSLSACRALGLAAVWVQILLAVELWQLIKDGSVLVYHLGNWPPPWGIVLVADRLAVWMLILTAVLALFALLQASQGVDRAGRHFQALFQWQLFGLNGAFLTGDLFNLFVFFEILLLASYALLVHGGGAERVRAGLQFTVINLVGSTLFLFAAGTLYGLIGTLNLADLAVRISQAAPEDLGLIGVASCLLFAVFALKAALAPWHLWLPSAYAAAAAPVAALFAIMTKVGVYALLRMQSLFFAGTSPLSGLYGGLLLTLGLATLLLGAVGALAATALRQQIAQLVVASSGLILVAFSLETKTGIASGLYYLTHSTLAVAAFFLLAESIARGRARFADWLIAGTLPKQAGVLGASFFLIALSIAGLPPLSGFIGKLALLQAALASPHWPWILGVVLVSSLILILALVRSGSLLFLNVQSTGRSALPPRHKRDSLWPAFGLISLGLALTLGAASILELGLMTAEQLLAPGVYIQAVLPRVGS